MNIEIVKQEKDSVELNVDNQTVVEVLRVYLNDRVDGVKFAAWRIEHPSKPILFKIQTSGKTVKKAVSDAIVAINKDCDAITKSLKK
jgi:DNA-directed RNA polymerase subunit L